MREARRLAVTQLAIGLEHVKIGGTMVVLLHKVEATDTVSLLYRFSKFSSVKLFKPTVKSSFPEVEGLPHFVQKIGMVVDRAPSVLFS